MLSYLRTLLSLFFINRAGTLYVYMFCPFVRLYFLKPIFYLLIGTKEFWTIFCSLMGFALLLLVVCWVLLFSDWTPDDLGWASEDTLGVCTGWFRGRGWPTKIKMEIVINWLKWLFNWLQFNSIVLILTALVYS